MFKNLIQQSSDTTWALTSLASILQVKSDTIIRQSVKASGFHVPHGIHGVIHKEISCAFIGDSPAAITTSLIAAVTKLCHSAKLASLTLFHLKDLVSRNMVADISRWDEPTESILKSYIDMVPAADISLAVRLMIEKPVTSDRWHLTATSIAFDSIVRYFSSYASKNKPKIEKETSPTSITIEDAAYMYQYLILLNLAINPAQLTSIVGYSPALATTGSIMNHSTALDDLATFMHALLNIPAHFSLEMLRQSRTAFADLFGSIPDSYELKYIEEVIGTCAPFDVFKVSKVATDLLNAPLFGASNSKFKPLYAELLSGDALKWINDERSKLTTMAKDLMSATDKTFSADGLLSIPREMRLISYIKDYNSFDRPLTMTALVNQTKLFAASLDVMVRRLTYQSRIFNLQSAKKLEASCNPAILMGINSVLFAPDPGSWSDHVIVASDSVVYGAVRPSGDAVRFIADKLGFVYGKASVIQHVIADRGSSLIYDDIIRKDFLQFFESWAVTNVPYPAHLIRGEGNFKLPKDDNMCSNLAELFSVSQNTFLELIETSPRVIATMMSSFAILIKDGNAVAGFGFPYGMSYEALAAASKISVTVDPERKISAKLIDFHITTSQVLANASYALGKSINFFKGNVNKSKGNIADIKIRLTNNVPLIQFCVMPINDAVLKPEYLITNKKILVNDNLSSRLADANPVVIKSDNKMFFVTDWKPIYGSDSWDLKRTTMLPILSEAVPDKSETPEYQKMLDSVILNVEHVNDQRPYKPEAITPPLDIAAATKA